VALLSQLKLGALDVHDRESCMRSMAIAAAIVLGGFGSAIAADLPPVAAPPPRAPAAYIPATPPVYNWAGIYVGVNGGYGFGRVNWLNPNTATSGNFNANGGFIGGTLGVNFQASALVFGVEGDVDWSRINGSASNTFCNLTGNCQTGNTWLSTLRGRIGVAADRVLIYGTGGGVFGNVQSSANGVTETSTKTGWTVGAGVEVAFDEHWTGKVDYLYANFGNATCTVACGSPALPLTFSLTDNLIRAGINFKF
jgi:outer membrane immunogenic protein